MLSNASVWRVCLAGLFWISAVFALRAEGQDAVFAQRAQQAFEQALKAYTADTNSSSAALALAVAGFDWSEFSTNDMQLAGIARTGVSACRRLIAREPESAAGQYYLAMNLGKLAQAEAPSISAYRMVYDVEAAFISAAKLDAHYDYAGPARNLGQLYFQAPGWPLSIGSKPKAKQWLELAVRLEPGYPENQLKLAEARLKWREREQLQSSLKDIAAIWPVARTNFIGQTWEGKWLKWEERRAALEKDSKKLFDEEAK